MSHKRISWVFIIGLYLMAFTIIYGTSYWVNEGRSRHASERAPVSSALSAEKASGGKLPGTNTAVPGVQAKSKVLPKGAEGIEKPAVLPGEPGTPRGKILRPAGTYYSSALRGYIFHAGTDYAEPEGAVIRAIQAGTVTFAGKDPLLGDKVTIDLGNSWSVTYGCLENLRVQEGDKVEVGTALGQVGFCPGPEGQGRPQLHYEVWHGDDVQAPAINTSFTS